MDTDGYGGNVLRKSVTLVTNDPNRPKFRLGISGTVEKVADVTPSIVYLQGEAGEKIIQRVSIFPNEKYPFKITGAKTLKDNANISFSLKEESAGGYAMAIENIKKEPGRYFEKIILSTTSPWKPSIVIHVRGNIRKAAAASDDPKQR